MKRLLYLLRLLRLLLLPLLCALMAGWAISARAAEQYMADGFRLMQTDDGRTVLLQPVDKTCVSYVIPDGVDAIGEKAFAYCTSMETLVIPDSVTTIGARAFEACRSLQEIILPRGLTAIEDNTFEDCSNLLYLDIPESVTAIGQCAFMNCTRLAWIELPANLQTMGSWTFYGCYCLRVLQIPEGVTQLEQHIFAGCNSLQEVYIPDSVTSIASQSTSSRQTQLVVGEGRRVIGNITRAASLFLVKTLYSFALALLVLFLPVTYPFQPIQLTLVSSLTIGIPSFFLALEPNQARIRGGFLQTVLLRAVPGAAAVTLCNCSYIS